MGKATGFIEYQRVENPALPEKERVENYREFHIQIPQKARREQASRCMDCGVCYCQSSFGCPLNNLVPEFNDMLYRGNLPHALARLLKTASFPEFTGRVCPALCEKACMLNCCQSSPVTTRENELYIIEEAFRRGLIAPRVPENRTGKRVAVIGSGPSGLAAADMLNRRGHTATVFERDDRFGGLLMYGIPNMKLEKGVIDRRIDLMRREGVVFEANQRADIGILNEFDAAILCCGAKKPRDLNVEGRDAKGVYFAVDFLKMQTRALLEGRKPEASAFGKRVIVVGGGDTGNDCVGTCIRQGCLSMLQIEMMPEPPGKRLANNPWPEWPRVIKTDYGQQEAQALFGHDPRVYLTTVKALEKDENGFLAGAITIKLKRADDGRLVEVEGSENKVKAELLLIAAGFTGCEVDCASAFGVEIDRRGNALTAPGTHKTGVNGLFTAGDMKTGQSLVVRAIADGRAAAREADEFLMGYTNL